MKRSVGTILGVLFLAALAVFVVLRHRPGNGTVTIGVVQPLTGELANFGKTVVNGITLAVEDYRRRGNGPEITLVVEDSQAKPAVAVSALQKLADVNSARFVLGELTSSSTLAMAPIARERRILLISATASNPKLSNAGPFFFRVWPSDSFDGMIAAQYCYSSLNARKAAVIFVNNDYGLGLKDVFQATFQKLGGEIVLVDAYPENTTDFRTILTKGSVIAPDVIYIPGHPRGVATLIKQARELNVTTPLFSNVAAEDKEFVTLAGTAAYGLYFTAPAFDIANAEGAAKAFFEQYKAKFAEEPDVHAVKGYEAAFVLLNALAKGLSTPDSISTYLHETSTFNVLSGAFRFDVHGDVITAMSIKRYTENGRVQIVDTVVPANAK